MSHAAGTGPGEITGDGCAVELYTLLPPFGEAEIVHAAVPEGASILELGCGTGRILKPLAALGHPVHGADDSPGMLARVAGLPVTRAAIESLRLAEKFDAVLLVRGVSRGTEGTGAGRDHVRDPRGPQDAATMSCEMEYRAGGRTWTQAWTCHELGAEELTADLAAAGLTFGSWLTEDQAWFTARRR